MNLTVVIPARNEEENILITLSNLENGVRTPHSVLVVNDHSTDKTADIVNGFSKTNSNVRLIDNNRDTGFANAVKSGFDAVEDGAVVTMMADNCDQPETIDEMFKKIEEGFDVICASRYMPGGKKMGGPLLQTFFSRFVGLSLRLIGGIPTYDISNAFKMYRKEVLNVINVTEAGFAMSMELTVKAYLRGFKIAEVPTVWRERTAGQSHFRIFKVAFSYIRIYMLAIMGMVKHLGRKKMN